MVSLRTEQDKSRIKCAPLSPPHVCTCPHLSIGSVQSDPLLFSLCGAEMMSRGPHSRQALHFGAAPPPLSLHSTNFSQVQVLCPYSFHADPDPAPHREPHSVKFVVQAAHSCIAHCPLSLPLCPRMSCDSCYSDLLLLATVLPWFPAGCLSLSHSARSPLATMRPQATLTVLPGQEKQQEKVLGRFPSTLCVVYGALSSTL